MNLFTQVVNLQDRWVRRAVPTVRSKSYELRQLFALRYELDEEAVDVLHNFRPSLEPGAERPVIPVI